MNCAWCGLNTDGSDSHSICSSCEALFEAQRLQRMQEKYENTPSYVEQNAAAFAAECDQLLQGVEVVA